MVVIDNGENGTLGGYKSLKTIELEKELQEIENKIAKVKSAKTSLDNVTADDIKETYDGSDSGDVFGTKYTNQTDDEKDEISTHKGNFMDKKKDYITIMDDHLTTLGSKKDAVNADLILSRAQDLLDSVLKSNKKSG